MAIRVAATLRLADHIAAGTNSPEALAARVHADPDALRRLMCPTEEPRQLPGSRRLHQQRLRGVAIPRVLHVCLEWRRSGHKLPLRSQQQRGLVDVGEVGRGAEQGAA